MAASAFTMKSAAESRCQDFGNLPRLSIDLLKRGADIPVRQSTTLSLAGGLSNRLTRGQNVRTPFAFAFNRCPRKRWSADIPVRQSITLSLDRAIRNRFTRGQEGPHPVCFRIQ